MRTTLKTKLSTCVLITAMTGLIGCAEQTADQLTGEKLEQLIDRMDKLEYAFAPTKDNAQAYTRGETVNGVELPGRIAFDAAYVDESLTLIPLAQDIAQSGNAVQQQAAQSILASIYTDEAGYLINAADRVFQQQSGRFASLRSRAGLAKQVLAHNKALAGDGAVIIDTIRTGETGTGTTVDGIRQLSEQVDAAQAAYTEATNKLAQAREKIEELREEALEYESLDRQLTNEANASSSEERFPKLEKAAEAMTQGARAEAEANRLATDAELLENQAELAQTREQANQAVISELESKIEQIRAERELVAGKLAELDADRQAALKALAQAYNEMDAMMQVGGFDRMAKATEKLEAAGEAIAAANLSRSGELRQMGLYTLHARSLHQQGLAARTYAAMLSTLAASGPETLGSGLHEAITTRIEQMDALEASVKESAAELKTQAEPTVSVMGGLDAESSAGQTASRLVELYRSLLDAVS